MTAPYSSLLPKWIVCQIGAREHYALASELHMRGLLSALCTDIWSRSGVWPLVSQLACSKKDRILGRFDKALGDARVFSQTPLELVAPMIEWASLGRPLDKWSKIMAANRSFGAWTAARLQRSGLLVPKAGRPPAVFAYSYAAKEIFETAKIAGCITVLGQIDPGPLEDSLVDDVARRHGLAVNDTLHPPQSYWKTWRDECDLADVIVANSAWSADLLASAGIHGAKIKVVPLAYRPLSDGSGPVARSYPRQFTRERPMVCLFLGQVNPRKGVVELLQAMEDLSDAPVRLKLVGPADRTIHERFKETLGVDWVGPVARSSTAQFYRDADVFILPTHSDGFAITQLEAVSNALPVIASTHCGDVIRHEVDGLLLKEVSPEAIGNAIRWLIGHPEHLSWMARQAPARLADFSPQNVVDRLLSAAGAL